MEYYSRLIDSQLLEWKNKQRRKPLLMRGARQVGKSSAVRNLAKNFTYFIEVNFEKKPELKQLFSEVSDVNIITQRLSAIFLTPVVAGQTLIFIDEIQDCPQALHSLWRFKEDMPDLHVIAAGSLLEFTLKEMSSFGVGRISSMFVYPMSFDEFLLADGKGAWIEEKKKAGPEVPLFDQLHDALVEAFRTYILIGGMPASVATWVQTHDYLQSADELDDIRQSYYDDFAKYSNKVDVQLLRNTLQSVIMQIGKKFVYSRVEGGYKVNEVKNALQLLSDAGLIKKVDHTAANGLPLGAEINQKFKKFIYLDSGLLLRILDMEIGGSQDLKTSILSNIASDLVNRGSLAEMVAGWEVVKYASPKSQHDLYYWENINNGTTSEVDYILTRDMKILPWEIKSGICGKMKSLKLFMQQKHIDYAIRSSLENFGSILIQNNTISEKIQSHYEDKSPMRIDILPLYAISSLNAIAQSSSIQN